MRSDFHEVLIERPRGGMRIKTRRDGKPQARLWDGEDGFEDCVPGRPNRTKHFNDRLSPLERWLRAQCNRPWDKVSTANSVPASAQQCGGDRSVRHGTRGHRSGT